MAQNCPIIAIPCRGDTSGNYHNRPIIAQNQAYIDAVVKAGGLPILIPLHLEQAHLEALFAQVDGLLFSGGGDIDPTYYGESPQVNLGDVQQPRDDLEIRLMKLAMAGDKPFLGVCRGFQVMNVAAGGKLWQDIASQRADSLRHDYFYDAVKRHPRNFIAHEVILEESSHLRVLLNTDKFSVNSLHHQGVKEVAPTLKPMGYAADGLVEVLELPNHPFGIGVQWHPEELIEEQATAVTLFAAFVEAAQRSRKS